MPDKPPGLTRPMIDAHYNSSSAMVNKFLPDQCYVLEDETRVLSQRGVTAAIGLNPDAGFRMPDFVAIRALRSFINGQLGPAVNQPILFKNPSGGGNAFGYPATLLVQICSAVLAARDAGKLPKQHNHIAHRCDILIRGFATVGIIALVDEATGYQDIRSRRALARILERFIAKELQEWVKTFPDSFYEEIYRLHGWGDPWSRKNHPQIVGRYTNDVVYSRIPPHVLDELRTKNPTLPQGYRENKHHQWLTPELGHPKLREHIAAVTALIKVSNNWNRFHMNLIKVFPVMNDQFVLDFNED